MSPTGNPSCLTLSFIFWLAASCHASTSSKLGNSLSTSSLPMSEGYADEVEEAEAAEAEEDGAALDWAEEGEFCNKLDADADVDDEPTDSCAAEPYYENVLTSF